MDVILILIAIPVVYIVAVTIYNKIGSCIICAQEEKAARRLDEKIKAVKRYIENGGDVNAEDKDGETPLYWAAYNGHLDIVCALVAKGVDVNAKDKSGATPLMWAAYRGHLSVVKFLIAKGADVNAKGNDGETVLYWAGLGDRLDVIKFLKQHSEKELTCGSQGQNERNTMTSEAMSQSQAERICNDFGKFLVERHPIIEDASLLPHPKARIMAALEMQEQHVCNIANSYVRSGKDLAPKEIVKYLEALRACRATLCYYSDIDAEDRNAATHFNSFRSLRDVPPEEKADCIHLLCKCGDRGMEAEVPGYTASVNSLVEKMKQKGNCSPL